MIRQCSHFILAPLLQTAPVWGAVRSLHTPNTGTTVTSLHQLKKNKSYVAAGQKGFFSVPGGYGHTFDCLLLQSIFFQLSTVNDVVAVTTVNRM